jgi:hypothetical protein
MSITPIAFVVAVCIAPVAFGADTIPPPTWVNDSISATTAHDPVVPFRMGNLEITLEITSLKEVQSIIRAGKIFNHGDASEAVAWLCYTISTSSPKQRLWLSSGEMGGLTTIDGITALEIPDSVIPSESCPDLPQRFLPLGFNNGLWLGTPEKTFRKDFGEVKKIKGGRSYIYIGKDGEYDVIGSMIVRFKNRASVAIYANHVTSN